MKNILLIIIFFLSVPITLLADAEHEMPPVYEGSVELQKIKALEGNWTGMSKAAEGAESEEVTVKYRVTSNGSAVIETLFEGTPMEMTSVYYDRDGKLQMTHYCAVANQPKLVLSSSEKNTLKFDFVGGENLNPKEDMHIHGLKIAFESPDKMTHYWTGYDKGVEKHKTVVELRRTQR